MFIQLTTCGAVELNGGEPTTYKSIAEPSPLPNSPLYAKLPQNDDPIMLHFKPSFDPKLGSNQLCDTFKVEGSIVCHKGKLCVGDESADQGIDVVCKFVEAFGYTISPRDARSLEREIELYSKHLRDLQGDCVPYFYGGFEANMPEANGTIICMLLEEAGEPVSYQRLRLSEGVDETFMCVRLHQLYRWFNGLIVCFIN